MPAHGRRDGRRKQCKVCDRARAKDLFSRNLEREREIDRERYRRNVGGRRDYQLARNKANSSPRMCAGADCGEPAISQRHKYCDACRLAAEVKRRGKSWAKLTEEQREARRAYDRERYAQGKARSQSSLDAGSARHVRLRNLLAPIVATGGVMCWRCGAPIGAEANWHLGHDDDDRSIYRGAEHATCNLRAGARAANQARWAGSARAMVERLERAA